MSDETFPRLAARTQNFTLGLPRGFVVSPDGGRVAFLRAASGTSRSHDLWTYDVAARDERLIADANALLAAADEEELTPDERARRERMRVRTSGVVGFSTDRAVARAAFALSSQLFVCELDGSTPPRLLPTPVPVVDPQLDPSGRRVAYAGGRALHVVDLGTGEDRVLVGPADGDPDAVVWGLAEFVAEEELDRSHGFWWSPDGDQLLVERYDESDVQVWHISDPAHPDRQPTAVHYPRAGTDNAVVSLAVLSLAGDRVDVDWASDRDLEGRRLEYLVHVEWSSGGPPVLTLLSRDQRRMELRELDPGTGRTSCVRVLTDECWVERLPGTPRRLDDGRLLYASDVGDTRRLFIDGEPCTPESVLVREVLAADGDGVFATVIPKVGSVALARLGFDGTVELLSDPDGVAAAVAEGGTTVVAQRGLAEPVVTTTVAAKGEPVGELSSYAEAPPLHPRPAMMRLGPRGFPTAVLFPTGHVPGSRRLPILLDPYGGPHGQRVVNAAHAYLQPQWFADQGFLVVVADGRGTAGMGPVWDRLAWHDRAGTADDQAEVVREVAARYPDDADATKVAIRGWSFGGYLAALCVLRYPDVFGAAIAGAPTTDERLYDTCYSERYLGDPREDPGVYEANSLMPLASSLSRPLLLIHGFADDNVFVAHSLRLSAALLAAGRPHEYLPLSGMTHMANDEVVAENLLALELDFLHRALDLPRA